MLEKTELSPNDRLALTAATSATVAAAALMQLVRDEDLSAEALANEEILERLLDAAKMVIEIGDDYREEHGQVYAAIERFIEGWA